MKLGETVRDPHVLVLRFYLKEKIREFQSSVYLVLRVCVQVVTSNKSQVYEDLSRVVVESQSSGMPVTLRHLYFKVRVILRIWKVHGHDSTRQV